MRFFPIAAVFIIFSCMPYVSFTQTVVADDLLLEKAEANERLFEKEYRAFMKRESPEKALNLLTVPVVLHILHNGGPENRTDAEVQNAINRINDAFANEGEYMDSGGSDAQIEFCLATQAPNGKASTGILRYRDTRTNFQPDIHSLEDLQRWPPKRYLNIRLVDSICDDLDCRFTGYGISPGFHGQTIDGVVVVDDLLENNRDAIAQLVRILGNYLGLLPTYTEACRNDNCLQDGDRVCDTPPEQSAIRAVCEFEVNSCNSDADDSSVNNPFRSVALGGTGDQNDLKDNFMGNATPECLMNFTSGQIDRMRFFLVQIRNSLLSAPSCSPPCPAIVEAEILLPSDSISIGTTLTLSSNSQNAGSYQWQINGQPISSFSGFDYTFDELGEYTIVLCAESNLDNCPENCDTSMVTVFCPAQSEINFTARSSYEYEFSTPNTGDELVWRIFNGSDSLIFEGGNPFFEFTFPGDGIYFVELIVTERGCEDRSRFTLPISTNGFEDCENGYDDNGDGLVDCFDIACNCEKVCEDFYYQKCLEECPVPVSQIKARLEWSYDGGIAGSASQLVVGDIDNDGVSEIVSGNPNDLSFALDPVLRQTDFSYGEYFNNIGTRRMAIADVNGDSLAEITFYEIDRIRQYRFDGSLVWENLYSIDLMLQDPSIYDINGDGRPELVFGNHIFDAVDGDLLLEGFGLPGKQPDWSVAGRVVFADVLDAGECPDCQGLELIQGPSVYSVNISSPDNPGANSYSLVRELPGFQNGFTSVADIDLDGQYEVAVVGEELASNRVGLYIWDPQTEALESVFQPLDQQGAFGRQLKIADVDNDGEVELCHVVSYIMGRGAELIVYDRFLNVQWRREIFEPSIFTGFSLFDLNGDDFMDFIVRANTRLLFINGRTLEVDDDLFCARKRVFDDPVVVDLDKDGHSEVVCSCGGRVNIYSSSTEPWMPSRPVWNQRTYYNTHIRDDLTVPPETQKPFLVGDGKELNTFGVQHRQKRHFSDFAVFILQDSVCDNGTDTLQMRICRQKEGIVNRDSFSIKVYPSDFFSMPDQEPLGQYVYAIDSLPSDSCQILELPLNQIPSLVGGKTGYLLFNYSDSSRDVRNWLANFPEVGFPECNYENNIDSFFLERSKSPPDLGPDLQLCRDRVFSFNVGSNYESYFWSDGSRDSIYTATEEGWHWVEVEDQCGAQYRDSVLITYTDASKPDLGPDLNICLGTTPRLSIDRSFRSVQWFPADQVSCDSCAETFVHGDTTIQVAVYAEKGLGCYGADTIEISFVEYFEEIVSLESCDGDSIEFNGSLLTENGTYTDTLVSSVACDTVVELNLDFQPVYEIQMSEWICRGDSFLLDDQWVDGSGRYTLNYETIAGCDSTLIVELEVRNRDSSELQRSICQGDSLQFGEAWLKEAGTYQYVGEEIYCDSLYLLDLQLNDTSYTELEYTLCAGDSVEVAGEWVNNPGMYIYELSTSKSCDSTVVAIVEPVEFGAPPEIEVDCEEPLVLANLELTGNFTQQWSNGDTSRSTVYLDGDSAWVIVFQDVSCGKEYRFDLPSLPDFFELPNWKDTTALTGEPFWIDLGLDSLEWQVRWSPSAYVSCDSCLRTRLIYDENAAIELELTHSSGCVYSYLFSVQWEEQNHIYVPNSFSPNDDGANDFWEIYPADHVELIFEAAIYNRWGGEMMRWENVTELRWNGRFLGKPMNPGVYVYYIRYMTTDGKERLLKGDLTLWR